MKPRSWPSPRPGVGASFSAGVPINDVSAVMGHEQTSTTLDRYTHPSQDQDQRVRSVLADFLLTPDPEPEPETGQEPTGVGS